MSDTIHIRCGGDSFLQKNYGLSCRLTHKYLYRQVFKFCFSLFYMKMSPYNYLIRKHFHDSFSFARYDLNHGGLNKMKGESIENHLSHSDIRPRYVFIEILYRRKLFFLTFLFFPRYTNSFFYSKYYNFKYIRINNMLTHNLIKINRIITTKSSTSMGCFTISN